MFGYRRRGFWPGRRYYGRRFYGRRFYRRRSGCGMLGMSLFLSAVATFVANALFRRRG